MEAGLGQWGKGRLVMAKIIEFYIPKDFRKNARQVASEKQGQVIEFASRPKKTARLLPNSQNDVIPNSLLSERGILRHPVIRWRRQDKSRMSWSRVDPEYAAADPRAS
jgi:hypothetical protein